MAKPLARPFLPDKAARTLGLITGVIMFAFVSMHLLNHAMLLVSEEAAGQVLRVFKVVWRNPLGALLLTVLLPSISCWRCARSISCGISIPGSVR